jgi:hypothetical protein
MIGGATTSTMTAKTTSGSARNRPVRTSPTRRGHHRSADGQIGRKCGQNTAGTIKNAAIDSSSTNKPSRRIATSAYFQMPRDCTSISPGLSDRTATDTAYSPPTNTAFPSVLAGVNSIEKPERKPMALT